MAYGYPYQQPAVPGYFNTNYMPQQPQQPQTGSNVTWVYVSGWDGARNQIVQPGQTVWMMDNNDPIIYAKAVDNMGSASLRAFRLTEISQQGGGNESGRYATANDLSAANERIGRLENALSALMKDLGGERNESTGSNNG